MNTINKLKSKILFLITILLLALPFSVDATSIKNKIASNNIKSASTSVNILPLLEMSLSNNSINFTDMNSFNSESTQEIVATVNSNYFYSIYSNGTDLVSLSSDVIDVSNISASIDDSNYKELNNGDVLLSENIIPEYNKKHNLKYKLNLPLETVPNIYNGVINIIVSNDNLQTTPEELTSFKITYKTTADNEQIELSLPEVGDKYSGYEGYTYKYNFIVDWGDGTESEVTSWNDIDKFHTYNVAGDYQVEIKGVMESWDVYDNNNGNSIGSYTKIISIDQWGETNFKYISFDSCKNITRNIPSPTINSFKEIKSFAYTFYECSGITGSIPENLFANCPNVTDFSYIFYGCRGLTGSIPENLFANNPNVTTFWDAFNRCTGLTGSIPENLFANNPNVTNFGYTFYYCRGLTGSIPENLFANNPNVTNFDYTFSYCVGLTGSIPENLFANSPNVTNFSDTFYNCVGLTGSIPENLFANNPNVTNFSYAFYNCIGLTGNAPELWNTHTKVTLSASCFKNSTNLSNYLSIPANWK